MTKIVINCSIGGFGLSNEGLLFYAHLKDLNIALYEEQENNTYKLYKKEIGKIVSDFSSHFCILPKGEIFPSVVDNNFAWENHFDPSYYDFGENFQFRSDPCLIKTVDVLEGVAAGKYCKFKIVEIPDDVKWHVYELEDGTEIIRENSRSWS